MADASGYTPENPLQLKYAPYRPITEDTVKFAQFYGSELIRRARSKPGPRDVMLTPTLRMGDASGAGVAFVLKLYAILAPYIESVKADVPDGVLGAYGTTYGDITPLLTYAGWPSSPLGTTIPNGATYAKTRCLAADEEYSEFLSAEGLDHVNEERRQYLATGKVAAETLDEWEEIIEYLNQHNKAPTSVHVQRHTNAGAVTFSSSPILKRAIIDNMYETGFAGITHFAAGELAKAAEYGTVSMAVQGRRFQNDGAKKKANKQPVEYPDPELFAKDRYIMSYFDDDILIANKMSPSPFLAAERVRSVQAQALAAGMAQQVMAQFLSPFRYEVDAMEYQDAVSEIESAINEHRPPTSTSVFATGDLTGADNCHPPAIIYIFSKSLRKHIGDTAYAVHGPDSFCPAVATSDDMTMSGGRFIGDPLNPSTFGILYTQKSGKGLTADEVAKYTPCYVFSSLKLMFKNTDEPYTMHEHKMLLDGAHPKYFFKVKGDGWLVYVRQPSGSRAKYESKMAKLLPACMVYMQASYSRDIGGYELYMDDDSKIRVTPSATNKINKMTLGDKTFSIYDRPFAASGWLESLKIVAGHPLMEAGLDSPFVDAIEEAAASVGHRFRDAVHAQAKEELAAMTVKPSAVGELLLRDEPSRRMWDPKYMTEEWSYLDKTLYVDIPDGFVPALFSHLQKPSSVTFADDVWERSLATWEDTFRNYSPTESAAPLARMNRATIGRIIGSRRRRTDDSSSNQAV